MINPEASILSYQNLKEISMKTLMSLMLGLSLLAGTTALFAADAPAPSKSTTKGKKKSGKKKKGAIKPAVEKKS